MLLMSFGPLELFIVLLIVVVLFGAGRISGIGRELGSAISNFRMGLREGQDKTKEANNE
jgi:sec-independent protein translocase protein TatA